MVAGARSCVCGACGVICEGRFPGCQKVWERGSRPVVIRPAEFHEPPSPEENTADDPPPVVDRDPGEERFDETYSDMIEPLRVAISAMADHLDDLSHRLDVLESRPPGLQKILRSQLSRYRHSPR